MFFSSRKGQGLVEYALLILLVGIAVIVLLALFGTGVGNMFSNRVASTPTRSVRLPSAAYQRP